MVSTRWVRPGEGRDEPRWGHVDGIQVGLHPLPGPRGLLRVYAPYLDHRPERLINFIAVEPVPVGSDERGYSELEHSDHDDAPGKRLWSLDAPGGAGTGGAVPARGRVTTDDDVEQLTVTIEVEPFANGAHVWLEVVLREDRPHEIGLAAFAHDDSVPLEACVLSATMGNFARLRQLHLADEVVTPTDLWPGFTGDHFTAHGVFDLGRLRRTEDGAAVVDATPDEPHNGAAEYSAGTAEHWRYIGRRAVQTWRVPDPDARLRAQVNGRHCYWASVSPIPGGTSYENFEIVEPFRTGRRLCFAVEPM